MHDDQPHDDQPQQRCLWRCGQLRTTVGMAFTVLLLNPRQVKIGQACMIQTLEKVHEERKSKVEGNPHSPAALHMSAIRDELLISEAVLL